MIGPFWFHDLLPIYDSTENIYQSESITVRLTSCLTASYLTKQVKMLFIQHKQSSLIQTNKQEVSRFSG